MSENKLDMIDDYLSGKLNASDRSSFEELLKNDTTLQNEVSLQKDILSSIKDVRKSELKARLNNLPVSTGISNLQKFGIAAVTISAGALLTFGLIQKTNNTNKEVLTTTPIVEEISTSNNTEVVNETPTLIQETESDVIVEEATSTNETITQSKTAISITEPIKAVNLPTPSPGMHNIEDPEGVHHKIEAIPNNGLSNDDKTTTASYKTTVEQSSKKFMYKYDGEHLTLIGDFSAKPYTVLETAANGSKKLYLKYDNNFYGITESKKAVNFIEIKNTELIQELKKK